MKTFVAIAERKGLFARHTQDQKGYAKQGYRKRTKVCPYGGRLAGYVPSYGYAPGDVTAREDLSFSSIKLVGIFPYEDTYVFYADYVGARRLLRMTAVGDMRRMTGLFYASERSNREESVGVLRASARCAVCHD